MILWRNIENYPFSYISIPTPDFPHFYYMFGGNLGSLLYGDVSVMSCITTEERIITRTRILSVIKNIVITRADELLSDSLHRNRS